MPSILIFIWLATSSLIWKARSKPVISSWNCLMHLLIVSSRFWSAFANSFTAWYSFSSYGNSISTRCVKFIIYIVTARDFSSCFWQVSVCATVDSHLSRFWSRSSVIARNSSCIFWSWIAVFSRSSWAALYCRSISSMSSFVLASLISSS